MVTIDVSLVSGIPGLVCSRKMWLWNELKQSTHSSNTIQLIDGYYKNVCFITICASGAALECWHDSMKRLRQKKIARIAPTLFGTCDDPGHQLREAEKRLDDAELWLEKVMSEDANPPIEALRGSFTEWMIVQATEMGLSDDVLRAYAVANPPA
jgi:hypothetical protein